MSNKRTTISISKESHETAKNAVKIFADQTGYSIKVADFVEKAIKDAADEIATMSKKKVFATK